MTPGKEKIVIVDDEQRMCESLTALLSQEGYDVVAYQKSVEAAEAIKKTKLDLLLTDIKMPQMGGLELLKIVKDVDEDIPVILMTGYASLDSAMDAISFGAYDYLMKPVEFTQLVLTVRRALEKRKAEELKISNLILHRRVNELNALYEAGKSIGSTANLQELLRQIVALASNVTEAQVGSIMLLDERKQYLTIAAAIGLEKQIVESTRLAIGESIAGSVAASGEPLIIDDVEQHPLFKRTNKDKYGGASLLCAPLKIKNSVIGVINMANKASEEGFTKNDLRLLSTFASQAAVAVDDANQFEKKLRRLNEFEILHEISTELPQINGMWDFRDTLVNKLQRVFSIDYCLWFDYDKENIPITSSGKIDIKHIPWEHLVVSLAEESIDFSDIQHLAEQISTALAKNDYLPTPNDTMMAIPIFKFGEPVHVVVLGLFEEGYYSEEDISLAKLVISQSAILFEK